MKLQMRAVTKGFTLIEIIITILIAGILGVVFVTYLGTSLTKSADPVNMARTEGAAEMVVEKINSDYVRTVNGAGFATALATLYATDYGPSVTKAYVTFDGAGQEQPGGTNDSLKITIQSQGRKITILFTQTRTAAADPAVNY
jgi:prepilin-type N-terminal cleavage/methylation domain-containing protein